MVTELIHLSSARAEFWGTGIPVCVRQSPYVYFRIWGKSLNFLEDGILLAPAAVDRRMERKENIISYIIFKTVYNRLTAIGFRREEKLFFFFFPIEGISTKKFAAGVSRWSYFLE